MTVKEDIIEIILAIYQVPGQYFIGGIISFGIGISFLELTNWGWLLIVFAIFLFALEVISPILAGRRLYEKAVKNLRRLFK